jgi:FkbH-like protein
MKVLSKETVQYVLQRAEPGRFFYEALALLRSASEGCAEVWETISGFLASHLNGDSELKAAIALLANEEIASAQFVRGGLLAHLGDANAALDAYQRAGQMLASPDPQILLQRARLLSRQGRFAEAIADVQLALRQYPSYSFFVKSEKLLDRLIASDAWKPSRRAKAAILSSSTTALLAPVLRASAFRAGLHLDIYEGVYGNYRQEILDPESGLYRFQPDLVLLIPNHRELALPASGGLGQAQECSAQLRELWNVLRGRNPCHVVQVGFDMPCQGAWGSLEYTLPEGRRRVIALTNLELSGLLPQGVSFLDINAIAAEIGPQFFSDSQWHASRQYPASAALPLLADHLCAHCAAALGLTKKVLVLDLDNTLWGGVIGEDLLSGIRIGPPSAQGEGYLELQKYVKDLQRRGILLAVCTKNNRADAELPFREHDAMLLKLDDFAAFKANWQDKATNLRAIAEELSLGLDSFIFLDDNPTERSLVCSLLPQVAVPECGQNPWEMLAALRRGLYFESIALTEEDLQRHAGYRGNAARKALETAAPSLDSFLRGLEMTVEHGPVDERTLPRVTQLINKTNQFNLTTRRYTEEQVRAMAESPSWWCRWFRLADRFGDHGLISVMLAKKGRPAWQIDTWLMSCRVLGRRMEDFICFTMLSAAQAQGAAEVTGRYFPTEKNALVKDLYVKLGFQPSADDPQEYVYFISNKQIEKCEYFFEKSSDAENTPRRFLAAA